VAYYPLKNEEVTRPFDKRMMVGSLGREEPLQSLKAASYKAGLGFFGILGDKL